MYPLHVFNLFPPFPRDNRVFVAMSFNDEFGRRWKEVIERAIGDIKYNGVPLEPYRVDMEKANDSILTEILTGIGNCRLFFADITAVGRFKGKPIRTDNVMYELGIAQAARLPEELILFRSDNEDLPFDIAHNRVHNYDPDNKPEEAREKVTNVIKSAFDEINLQKHLAVKRAAESLDFNGWVLLNQAKVDGKLEHPVIHPIGLLDWLAGRRSASIEKDFIDTIPRLLELGVISSQYTQVTPRQLYKLVKHIVPAQELVSYKITPFGSEVIDVITKGFLFGTPVNVLNRDSVK